MENNYPDGRYAVVDTLLNKTDSTLIDALSGTQGDSGRIVYFALKDGSFAHNLDGQDVSLQVKDAVGKVKIVNGIYDRIDVTRGLFSMLIPAEVYQAAGDVEEARLVVTDSNSTVISTIPITFTVFANGIILSANASQDYIDTVQKFLDEFDKRITTTSNNLEGVRTAVNSLNDAITNYTDLVNTKAAAVKASTNEFTEDNTFDKDITVKGAIHGKADKASKADSATEADSAIKANTADNLESTSTLDNSMKIHNSVIDAFGGKLTFTRSGNTVSVRLLTGQVSFKFADFATVYIAKTIPAGYRPANDYEGITLQSPVWLEKSSRKDGTLKFTPAGEIISNSSYIKDDLLGWIKLNGTYITADDMPED